MKSYKLKLPRFEKPTDLMKLAIADVEFLAQRYKSYKYNATEWCVVSYDGKPINFWTCLAGALIATRSNFKFPKKAIGLRDVCPNDFGYEDECLLNLVDLLRIKGVRTAVSMWNTHIVGSDQYAHVTSLDGDKPSLWPENLPSVNIATLEGATTLCDYYVQSGI